MKIEDYVIPSDLQSNSFIRSLKSQSETKKLSERQLQSLIDILEIPIDFMNNDLPNKELYSDDKYEYFLSEYHILNNKLKRNRFRRVKNRNNCIRAIQTILNGNPDIELIDKALNRNYRY